MKRCYKCKLFKNEKEFYKSKERSDGFSNICKICNRERGKQYRLANKEKEIARHALYLLNNANSIRECQKRYYQLNKEKYYKNNKKWGEKNRERLRELWRKHSNKTETKHKHRINEARRRACKLKATPKWLSKTQLEEIKLIYDTCPIDCHVDHIVPLRGKNVCGLHVPWNLQHLSSHENQKKNNKLIL